jgi:hypothetical protein
VEDSIDDAATSTILQGTISMIETEAAVTKSPEYLVPHASLVHPTSNSSAPIVDAVNSIIHEIRFFPSSQVKSQCNIASDHAFYLLQFLNTASRL